MEAIVGLALAAVAAIALFRPVSVGKTDVGGQAVGEPVVAHGPFVMNTREEITQAIRDYQSGLFDVAPRSSAH